MQRKKNWGAGEKSTNLGDRREELSIFPPLVRKFKPWRVHHAFNWSRSREVTWGHGTREVAHRPCRSKNTKVRPRWWCQSPSIQWETDPFRAHFAHISPNSSVNNNKSPPSHLTRVLDLENLSSGSRWGRGLICLGLNTSIFHTLFKKAHIKQKRIKILREKSAICLSLSD